MDTEYKKINKDQMKYIIERINYIISNNDVDNPEVSGIMNYLSYFPYDYKAMFFYHRLVEFVNSKKKIK